jgi:hypothetical protein
MSTIEHTDTEHENISEEPSVAVIENAVVQNVDGPAAHRCPTDGTIVTETDRIEGTDRYECPTCRGVRSEEVLRW